MKEDEYKPEKPHALYGSAKALALSHGFADLWTEEEITNLKLGPYMKHGNAKLNAAGMKLLQAARDKNWNHNNFYYNKKLQLNTFSGDSFKSLIEFVKVDPIDKPSDFVTPQIDENFKKPQSIDLYDHHIQIGRHQTGVLKTNTKVAKPWAYKPFTVIQTIWDSKPQDLNDFSLFNWDSYNFPYVLTDLLTSERIANAFLGNSLISNVGTSLEVMEILKKLNQSELQKELEQEEIFTNELKHSFTQLIVKHGLFIGLWFNTMPYLFRNITKLISNNKNIPKLFMDAYRFTDIESNRSDLLVNQITGHIFWQLILYTFEDTDIKKQIQTWIKEFSKDRNCILCDRQFTPILTTPTFYFGTNGNVSMCFGCIEPKTPDIKKLPLLISEFVEACGFPPHDSITPIDHKINMRLSDQDQIKVVKKWIEMGGIHYVKNSFGISWFEAMYQANCLPDGTMKTPRGTKCVGKDGHICNSLDEKIIDDFMFLKKIPHEKEPFYPLHKKLNPNGKKRADWRIGECFIEYFGLTGDPTYDKKTISKIQLLYESGFDLIDIYPEDLIDVENSLTNKFVKEKLI